MARLEFFFDCSSPWTYLAFHRTEKIVAEAGAERIRRPVLVGRVFNAVNRSVYEAFMDREDMYFGNDRLDLVHRALAAGQPGGERGA